MLYQERRVRQRLLALSDPERGPPSLPIMDFLATIRITEVSDGDRAFVEWWATFDCEPVRRDELIATLRGWFVKWLESLRTAPAEALPHVAMEADA